ncbi:MAG: hypothetical protein WCK29_01150, partial [archaeon]
IYKWDDNFKITPAFLWNKVEPVYQGYINEYYPVVGGIKTWAKLEYKEKLLSKKAWELKNVGSSKSIDCI